MPMRRQQRRRLRVPVTIGNYALGAMTPAQAVEEVFPSTKVTSSAGHTQSVRDQILASVNAGQIVGTAGVPEYVPGTKDCSATGQSANVKIAQTAAGMALTGTTIGLTAAGAVTAAALAPWTLGISAIIGLFPVIFGHHAKAVKKEQSILCAAVPAANNYIQIISQAVQQGLATPQNAIAALDSLFSDFKSQVSSILKGSGPASSGSCNAACVEIAKLQAIVEFNKSVFQDMIAAASSSAAGQPGAAAASSVFSSSTSVGGIAIPSWALYAAGGLLLWKLL